MAGGISMVALTFVQFLNPSANWYALFATVLLVAVTAWMPREARWRFAVLGALVMTVFMLRQLTGAFVAIGLITYLLTEEEHRSAFSKPVLGRAILALCAVILGVYLFKNASFFSILMFGVWPIALIVTASGNCVMSDRAVIRMAGHMMLGALMALAPLVIYHLSHGSLMTWIDDTLLTAFRLVSLPFIDKASYLHLPLVFAGLSAEGLGPRSIVNGLFWMSLLMAPPILGWITVKQSLNSTGAPVLAHMAVFFGLVSVHYEIAVYLFYSVALVQCGLLALSAAWSKRAQVTMACTTLLIAAVGLWSHAGQPLTRGLIGQVAGERTSVSKNAMDHRVGLRVAQKEQDFYQWLVPLIEKNSRREDSILALPVNPELYFMTGRRNPTRFFNSALGLRTPSEVQVLLSTLVIEPPALVIFNSGDKYVTPAALKVMDKVRSLYKAIASRDGIEVYARRR
ncbi:MAG: hypothetical protein HOK82_03950 [Rhodospirillaceae bacterium]|nr:hypothetical protein [Rhodospirillaceae bacterium]